MPSPQAGYLKEIDAREIGETAVDLGAGRTKKGEKIDLSVGIVIHHKVGAYVQKDEPLFTIHANDLDKLEHARDRLIGAHRFSDEACEPLPLFYDTINGSYDG